MGSVAANFPRGQVGRARVASAGGLGVDRLDVLGVIVDPIAKNALRHGITLRLGVLLPGVLQNCMGKLMPDKGVNPR